MIKISIEPCKVPIPEHISDWLIKRAYTGIIENKECYGLEIDEDAEATESN